MAITCDEYLRIKQDVCRIKYDSFQDSGITFHQGITSFNHLLFFSPFFLFLRNVKASFPFHILPLITDLINRHSIQHSTDFSQGIMFRNGPQKHVSIYNCLSMFCKGFLVGPLTLKPYVHLLFHMQYSISGVIG